MQTVNDIWQLLRLRVMTTESESEAETATATGSVLFTKRLRDIHSFPLPSKMISNVYLHVYHIYISHIHICQRA